MLRMAFLETHGRGAVPKSAVQDSGWKDSL